MASDKDGYRIFSIIGKEANTCVMQLSPLEVYLMMLYNQSGLPRVQS